MNQIGYWSSDQRKLPYFTYTGRLPFQAELADGRAVKLPENPWSILGNPQITAFPHMNGACEIITGRRSWGRMNQGKGRNSAAHNMTVMVGGVTYPLWKSEACHKSTEEKGRSATKQYFGCGFATWEYDLQGIRLQRIMSVRPAKEVKGGTAALRVDLIFTNSTDQTADIDFTEGYQAAYQEIQYQAVEPEKQPVQFTYLPVQNMEAGYGGYHIEAASLDPLIAGKREEMTAWEGFPPSFFVQSLSDQLAVKLEKENRTICCQGKLRLEPGEQIHQSFLLTLLPTGQLTELEAACKEMQQEQPDQQSKFDQQEQSDQILYGYYAEEWNQVLPDFPEEKEEAIRQELRYHAYVLEAMATYSEYYDETKIPQGTAYDYDWGKHASARDNFQHALPLAYYHPELCKSVLRYLLKRTTPFGEIRLIESGNGYAEQEAYFTSDQQLFFFLLLSEYLRITGDLTFLEEKIKPYPVAGMPEVAVLHMVEKCFVFLRDTIGVGAHGLIRLYNSDWNDTVYYIEKVPYNTVVRTGESHMNSAMALSILPRLSKQLVAYKDRMESVMGKGAGCTKQTAYAEEMEQLTRLLDSMQQYKSRIQAAFLQDLGERDFPRRMYFAGKAYGEENMFLEPMGYTLWMQDFPVERKRILYCEMKKRLYAGEILGARQQQTPEFESPSYDKGSRENGGFWWALNGPVIMGLSTFDKPEAQKKLKQMFLQHLAQEKPDYWSSYWSAADNLESHLIPEEGLPDQSDDFADQPVYCAHPHAWILYCYYYLQE